MKASVPRSHGLPMPSDGRGLRRPSAPSFGASEANAVLQDLAKSMRNGTAPSSKLWEFLNVRPSTVKVFGQATGRVERDRAVVEQPERGDHLERRAGRHLGGEGQVVPAAVGAVGGRQDAPSLTRTATSAERRLLAGQGGVGRVLRLESSVVFSGWPAFGSGGRARCRVGVAVGRLGGTIDDRTPGVPRSRSSYCSCRPTWPTRSPTRTAPGSRPGRSLVAVADRAEQRPGERPGRREVRVSSWNTVPGRAWISARILS